MKKEMQKIVTKETVCLLLPFVATIALQLSREMRQRESWG